MSRSLLVVLLLVLSLIGLADSWYLFQSAITDTALTCNIGSGFDGCNTVAQSPYSHLFGIPLGLYGVGFYAVLFVLAALILVLPQRLFYRALHLFALAGVLASAVFVFIQLALIKAVCIYCLISAGITLFAWVIARTLLRRFSPPHLVSIPDLDV